MDKGEKFLPLPSMETRSLGCQSHILLTTRIMFPKLRIFYWVIRTGTPKLRPSVGQYLQSNLELKEGCSWSEVWPPTLESVGPDLTLICGRRNGTATGSGLITVMFRSDHCHVPV